MIPALNLNETSEIKELLTEKELRVIYLSKNLFICPDPEENLPTSLSPRTKSQVKHKGQTQREFLLFLKKT